MNGHARGNWTVTWEGLASCSPTILLQDGRRLLIEITQQRGLEDPEVGEACQSGAFEVLKTTIGADGADDSGGDQGCDGTGDCDGA